MSEMNEAHPSIDFVEQFIQELKWSEHATDHEKTLVAGNLRNFANHLRKSAGQVTVPTGPTVKMWLPVVVLRDGRYWAYRGSSSNENDCLEDAQLFADRHLGIVHIVTAELPIPQKPEPIEVQGEVEHERDT